MPYSDPKINNLTGGWYAVLHNGEVYTEDEMSWVEVPNKKDIKIMGLKRMNKHYELEGKKHYCAPGETHMRELYADPNGECVTQNTLIGWFIGYYAEREKVLLRVNAITGSREEQRIPYTENLIDS